MFALINNVQNEKQYQFDNIYMLCFYSISQLFILFFFFFFFFFYFFFCFFFFFFFFSIFFFFIFFFFFFYFFFFFCFFFPLYFIFFSSSLDSFSGNYLFLTLSLHFFYSLSHYLIRSTSLFQFPYFNF